MIPTSAPTSVRGSDQGEIQRKHAQPDRPERHQTDLDELAGHAFAQQRPQPDADRKGRHQKSEYRWTAPQDLFGVIGHLGNECRAVEPKPRNTHDGQKDGAVLLRGLDDVLGFGDDIERNRQGWIHRGGARDAATGEPAGNGNQHQQDGDDRATPGLRNGTEKGTEQDGEKCAHLHHAVTANQLLLFEVLGQNRVLDRPKKR